MRVRKAVPEGYKTDSKFGAFTLWAEDSTTTTGISASTASSGTYSSTMRELEPFCGINKVGGLAFQPSHNAIDDAIDYTTMPSLTNSQDSVFSTSFSSSTFVPAISANIPTNTTTPAGTFTTTLPTRKRSFLPEEDEVVRDNLSTSLPYRGSVRLSTEQQREGWLDGEVSPRTLALPAEMWENSRVLAVPRRARQHRKTGGDEGEENVMIAVLGQDGNDFEEASFLDYNGVVEEDAEMAG
ncbi:hypothetical protein N0V88_003768 [Collariella sp. IMI 366227]|nr:hypothetical protein N0V88_003768 [Collariella sp. IMI 366227]